MVTTPGNSWNSWWNGIYTWNLKKWEIYFLYRFRFFSRHSIKIVYIFICLFCQIKLITSKKDQEILGTLLKNSWSLPFKNKWPSCAIFIVAYNFSSSDHLAREDISFYLDCYQVLCCQGVTEKKTNLDSSKLDVSSNLVPFFSFSDFLAHCVFWCKIFFTDWLLHFYEKI